MIVGIIGAMEAEIVRLLERMNLERTREIATLTFYEGKLGNAQLVLVKSGIGKVNAALCAQILIDRFEVEAIINTGVAGALHPDLEVGDIVLATEVLQHDIDASIFGDPRGIIPGLKESVFATDSRLLESCCSQKSGYRIVKGRIVTGDQAVGDSKTKEFLYSHFHGTCVEMEGGAIGHVCYLNQIPFMVIRAISDKANEEVEVDYGTFMKESAIKSAEIVEEMLHALK